MLKRGEDGGLLLDVDVVDGEDEVVMRREHVGEPHLHLVVHLGRAGVVRNLMVWVWLGVCLCMGVWMYVCVCGRPMKTMTGGDSPPTNTPSPHSFPHLRVAAGGKDRPAVLGVDAGERHAIVPVGGVGRGGGEAEGVGGGGGEAARYRGGGVVVAEHAEFDLWVVGVGGVNE